MPPADLHVQLESELPAEIAVGRGTALFVCGWCYSPHAAITGLQFVLDGRLQPVEAFGMPRLDPFRALHPTLDPFATARLDTDPDGGEDPELRSYRSGFWGIVRIGLRPGGEPLQLGLRAELADERAVQTPLATIALRARAAEDGPAAPWPPGASGPRVAIAMATYNPPAGLLERQLDSIRAQSHANWICVISDDRSAPEPLRRIEAAIAGDPRFVLSPAPRRQGFYRNFERALELVPESADAVALADQDDVWHFDKLAALLAARGDAELVYSDARVLARDGRELAPTWWGTRRNNHTDLLSLLVANAVTGAASLFDRRLLDDALPFPPAQFAHYHDHWLGLVALCRGEITFVARPLYDYVQHGEASLGHAAANQMTPLADRLRHPRPLRERIGLWRLHYFVDICRLRQFATVLELRCGDRMDPAKRAVLSRFLAAERSPAALAGLTVRGLRELVRPTPETLGAEWMLACALGWRRLLGATVRDRPQARLRLDALPPPTLYQEPGRRGLPEPAAAIADKIAPLRWSPSADAPPRINILIPTVDLVHFFGGYIAKFNLAARLVDRGHRVRIVTVDPVGPLPGGWRATLESYAGLAGRLDHVEVAFGRESASLEVSPADVFVATTWWTAHIARHAVQALGADRFLYLIQEYEPFTFPMGSYAALAAQSYEFHHHALFSSELLRGYFRAHAIGVYARGADAGDRASAAFQNAITAVPAPSAAELAARGGRRLLFYARPESHAARNMFELGVLALHELVRDGTALAGWELNGIGTTARGDTIELGSGARLQLAPRAGLRAYGELLRAHDVGLALMYTPHPSLVPIEMASAGMVTVTTRFENKTPEALAAISPNLIAAPPTVAGIAAGLRAAVGGVTDYERRARGAHVAWSTDWRTSFPDELLDRVAAAVAPR